jgi:hypothetical protein
MSQYNTLTPPYKNATDMIKPINFYFKKVIQNPKSKEELEHFMNTEIKTTDTLEAFRYSMEKNYSPIPKNWHTITKYKGAQMLSDYIKSINTFTKYVKKGFFRTNSKGDIYLEEIEKYRDACVLIYKLWKNDVLQHTKEFGESRIVLFPSSIDNLGLNEHKQEMKAGLLAIKEPWFQDWINRIDFDM